MKYIMLDWPEIQDYMFNPNFREDCYFDPVKNKWFVPEDWIESVEEPEYGSIEYFDMIGCWDAIGGDWYG